MKQVLQPALYIHLTAYQAMLNHVSSAFNEEVCGLSVGRKNTISQSMPVENVLHNPDAYQMNPQEQVDTFLKIEKHNLELLAIYHSHPSGPDHPSQRDIREFTYPNIATIIWSPISDRNQWQMKAFYIQGKGYSQIEWFCIK